MNKWQLQEAKVRFSELIDDTPSGTRYLCRARVDLNANAE